MEDQARIARGPGFRLLLAALVCLQVSVPVWATVQGVPHKLGFHMFTGYEPVSIEVRDSTGAEIEVDLSDWVVVRREDIDWSATGLPERLCADVEGAATVVVRQWQRDREHEC